MAAEDYLPWGEGWYGIEEMYDQPDTTDNDKKPEEVKRQLKGLIMGNIPTPKMPVRPMAKAPTTAANGGTANAKANLDDLFATGTEDAARGIFTILYGKGGTGKTTAALTKPGSTVFIDLEGSYDLVAARALALVPDGTAKIKPFKFKFTEDDAAGDYERLCALIEANGYDGYDTVILDSWSVVQRLLMAYTFTHEPYKGKACSCTDDYGYQTYPCYAHKGFVRLYNAILNHRRAGRDFVVLAHALDDTVPDMNSDKMKQWVPDILQMKSGKDSMLHDMFNEADNCWFFDDGSRASSDKQTKGQAVTGSRTVYLSGTGVIMAKTRTAPETPVISLPNGEPFPWDALLAH